MRQLTFIIVLLLLHSSRVIAFEEVFLDTNEINKLQIPTSSEKILEAEREYKALYAKQDDYYFEKEEEDVFENNTGRKFTKFIDNVVINNKLNQKLTNYEEKYLDKNDLY